jgi:hypothetical protein
MVQAFNPKALKRLQDATAQARLQTRQIVILQASIFAFFSVGLKKATTASIQIDVPRRRTPSA